ncbi:Hypothetical protein ORPV_1197 [Orpheovirus IHUMI-LCC2]|uniref:Uncharacterized protein n=1 Tax=Orpheovirus IHUMI-LCC2 TaxID=2023057 RepID=A0A2I2L6G1_9VIRU|nr:Hypothetical protein ORPV_1197 [Orpheovirus IHUMI-LCC2]SNW63101.1 Hypothetical protein ORPV_1197 [Orpheovirus IHUMI-LCC2]
MTYNMLNVVDTRNNLLTHINKNDYDILLNIFPHFNYFLEGNTLTLSSSIIDPNITKNAITGILNVYKDINDGIIMEYILYFIHVFAGEIPSNKYLYKILASINKEREGCYTQELVNNMLLELYKENIMAIRRYIFFEYLQDKNNIQKHHYCQLYVEKNSFLVRGYNNVIERYNNNKGKVIGKYKLVKVEGELLYLDNFYNLRMDNKYVNRRKVNNHKSIRAHQSFDVITNTLFQGYNFHCSPNYFKIEKEGKVYFEVYGCKITILNNFFLIENSKGGLNTLYRIHFNDILSRILNINNKDLCKSILGLQI